MKIAYHARGIEVQPEEKAEFASSEELEPLHFFLNKYMPSLQGQIEYKNLPLQLLTR